jgi:hypothetical protein
MAGWQEERVKRGIDALETFIKESAVVERERGDKGRRVLRIIGR